MDLLIIGAGPGGYELAADAHKKGYDVTLIERDRLGGTCLNRGCIPTKALLASAGVIRSAREAAEFGVNIEGITPEYSKASERKEAVINQLREGVAALLSGVNVIEGEARFIDARTVEVNGERYTADRIVIATGSAPTRLPIPGADLAITSDELLELTELPRRVAIIGGGVIGIEFANILHEFGVEVTVVEYCKEILPPFDKDIAKRLRITLTRRGINIVVGAGVTEIQPGKVIYESKGKSVTIDTDLTVMAVGRRPVIPQGLDSVGVEITRRGITVNEKMETNVPRIYAIGDVNGRCMLAHAASAQGRVVLGEHVNLDVIPAAVFTHPECAMAGLTEEQCKERELNYKCGKSFFRANGKALSMGETDGLVKLLYDPESRAILGCHIMGPHAADLIQQVADLMAINAPVDTLHTAVHGHPTLSEVLPAALS